MAHEIETMAWTNEVPWHGLGVEVAPDLTPEEMMQAAGLDWTVTRQPMLTKLPDATLTTVPDYAVLVRSSDNKILGPCGPRFVPTQNIQAFEFLRRFTDAGHMTMETAGSLKGGTEIWALARFRDDFEIANDDVLKGYLLVHIAHIWGKGNTIKLTPIRVVCNNTLTMSLRSGDANSTFRMPHLQEFTGDLQDTAAKAIGMADEQLDQFSEAATFLTKKAATSEQVQDYIARVYQPQLLTARAESNDQAPLHADFNPRADKVWAALSLAPGQALKSAEGTWWGAFNAVTYFEDHMRETNADDRSGLLSSAWVGGGAKRKNQALEMALEYARAA